MHQQCRLLISSAPLHSCSFPYLPPTMTMSASSGKSSLLLKLSRLSGPRF